VPAGPARGHRDNGGDDVRQWQLPMPATAERMLAQAVAIGAVGHLAVDEVV
jgi:hypothetical protein